MQHTKTHLETELKFILLSLSLLHFLILESKNAANFPVHIHISFSAGGKFEPDREIKKSENQELQREREKKKKKRKETMNEGLSSGNIGELQKHPFFPALGNFHLTVHTKPEASD